MTHRLYIFDLDGTLVDSFQDLADAVNGTLAAMGCESLTSARIKQHVGLGARWMLARCIEDVGRDSERDMAEARAHFLPLYKAGLANHTRPYPGVEETLEALSQRGATLAICTNKPIDLARPLLSRLGLASRFAQVLGGDSLPSKKPDPAPLLHILDALDMPPQEAIMIGDSNFDIIAGQAAGVHTCGVTYGHHDSSEIEALAPDWVIHEMPALLTLGTTP